MDIWEEKAKQRKEYLERAKSLEWEPSYGFCADNETSNLELALVLESIRRSICAYGGGNRCDCKYGKTLDLDAVVHDFGHTPSGSKPYTYSEQTGCPELREMIHRLLHRDTPLI